MSIRPSAGGTLRLAGQFAFVAEHPDHGRVSESFNLRIDIPAAFPRKLPIITETGGRIPRCGEFHVNGDGSLCLGSDLRLLEKLNRAPTLPGLAARCIVPYLYAISLKLKNGGPLVFGELAHGGKGMLQDYARLFSLPDAEKARKALALLAVRKRIANKHPCPCGCGLRLGRCPFHFRLLRFRRLTSRSWFRSQLRMTKY